METSMERVTYKAPDRGSQDSKARAEVSVQCGALFDKYGVDLCPNGTCGGIGDFSLVINRERLLLKNIGVCQNNTLSVLIYIHRVFQLDAQSNLKPFLL
ncbi:hypothetical protein LguiB_006561 [Lonicera macranthoides]